VIHEHGLVVCLVDATPGGGSLFGQSELDADASFGQKKSIHQKCPALRRCMMSGMALEPFLNQVRGSDARETHV